VDEKTYGQIAYHMLKSATLSPVNGEPEPGLQTSAAYVAYVYFYQVLGVTNFSTRVWVPLSVLSLVVTYRQETLQRRSGMALRIILDTFTTFYSYATHAMTDVPLVFFMV
jgi:4-amino-4-deoxy-L-arabinose transferase-like glycosyltransferase